MTKLEGGKEGGKGGKEGSIYKREPGRVFKASKHCVVLQQPG